MKVEKYLSAVLVNYYVNKNLSSALKLIKNCFTTVSAKTVHYRFSEVFYSSLTGNQLSKIVLLIQNTFALINTPKFLSGKSEKTKPSIFSWSVFIALSLIFLSPFMLSGQVTLTFEPTSDCDIDSGVPNTNWGTCNEMWVTSVTRTLTKFDVSSIPAGAKILSASIALYQYESPGTNGNIEIRKITNAWNEGSGSCSGSTSQAATWNQRISGTNWTTAGGDFSSTVYANCQVGTAIKYYTWNITTLVQEWVDGSANHGLIFKNSTESGSPTFKFYSSESASNKPVITITYIVDPMVGPVMHTADQKTASGSGNSVSVAKPNNVSQGDLILLVFSHQRSSTSSSSSFSTPSGFTLIRSEHDITSNNRTEVVAFYKIASDNEPSTYTSSVTTYSYTPQWKAYAVRVTGFDPYDPIDTHVGSNSGSASIFEGEIPAMAVAKDNALLVSATTVRMATSSVNVPVNMFLASFANGTGTIDDPNNAATLKICYQNQLFAGTINPVYHSWVGSARASDLLFGINPANDLYCAENKLINAGFESQGSRWGTWGAPTYTTDKRTGDYAVNITDGSSGYTQDFIGSVGKTYTATAYAKGSNTIWTNLTIEFFTSSWSLISTSTNVGLNVSSSYAPTTVSAIAPAGTYYIQIVFGAGVNSGGYVRIDDICLTESDYVEAPGGITGSAIWLKANKGLSTGSTLNWSDQSGFNRNGVQSTSTSVPALSSAAFNYNPALTFDGSNDNIAVQNLSGLPTGASSVQMFAVANHTNITRGWNHIFTYGSGNTNQIFGLGKHTGTANATTMLWSYDAVSTAGEFANNQIVLLDGKYTGSQAVISSFGTQKGTVTSTGNKTTSAGYIGVDPVLNSGTYWQGNISEVLVYPGNLTTAQVLRINSYLALKYGITLNQTTAQNYLASDGSTIYWNGTTNSSHKNNIAGIVRDDISGLHQKQSKSSNSGLQIAMGHGDQIASTNILNANALSADKSALVWGDNNGSVSSWTTTGAPSGYSVVARSWKVQETGTVGSVKLQVASSAGSNGLPSVTGGVFLLVDADGNFTSGASVYTMTLNGVNYETNIDLSNGQFFTFATCTTIGNPVFALGSTSTRCQASGIVTYTATSTNSTGITYTLDGTSLSAGNTINASTGAVTYVSGWSGTSTITATAQGCGGPKTANHTVTITPYVGTPVFASGGTSSRCQGNNTVTYSSTASNSTGITYSLDATSLSGGNTINASTGAVTFAAGWTGNSTITASAAGCNGPTTAIHVVTTTPSVQTPVFEAGSTSTRCQGSAIITYGATAGNNTGLTYTLDLPSSNAGNTINASTGAVTFVSDWSGTTIITVTAQGCNGPTTATHTVTVNPSVQSPVFQAGTFVNRCGQVSTETYTATAQNSTQITYALDVPSLNAGNTIGTSTGQVTWTSGWVGASTITATAHGCNGPLTASLIVESAGVFAIDDAATGTQGKPLYIQLTTNDLCNYNANSITIVSPPQSGNVQMGTNGQVVYLPAGNFSGNDAFVYQICQTSNPGICDQATVNVTIEETFIDPCAEATRNKTYFLPFEENSNLRNALLSAGSVAYHSNTVRTLVSIKVPYPGIKITYDHWEDGYESNIQNPFQSTTQIWGDGNLNNGIAPGYPNDILPPGAYIVLDNQFQYNPRVSSTIAYDGRDKIFTTGDVSISKVTGDAGFGGGSVLFDVQNLKTNVYDISRYGEYFVVPFGEDVTLGSTVAFRYTGIYIKAAQNGTQITFDYNADGVVDFTQTLNQGEFWYYTGTASQPGSYPADVNNSTDIKAGAVVTASQPVGVDLIFGDGYNFGTRNMALLPSVFNANLYYTPVYTTTPSNADNTLNTPVYVFFTNVLDDPIDVMWTSKTNNGSFTIPANGIQYFEIPYTSSPTGYKFESTNEEPFAAVTIVDGDSNGSRYDWAFNLIPEERLTEFSSIAWAPGSRDGAGNYNPIWVTPVGNTTLYIKLDGNLTGITSTMSPCGIPYDLAVPLDVLSSYQIFDNTDNDQSGTAIYTCDGTKFVAVWGQNSNANGDATPPGSPAQDVGYVLEPKCLEALIFANDDSKFTEPNTPITIAVTENDFAFLSTLNPSSVNTIGLLQTANGNTITNGNGTITYTPNNGFIGTDYFEYRVCAVEYPALCDVALVTVRVSDCPAEDSQNLISGKVFIEQLPDDGQYNNESPAWGVQVDLYLDSNCNNSVDAGENVVQSTLSDPSGNYSFSVLNGFNAADNFEPTPSFTTNNGGITWSSAWIEQNDDLNANSGYIRIMADASSAGSGNAIRLSANGSMTLRGISRSLTFSNATAATLKFKFRRQSLNNQGEQLQVLINGVQVLAFDDGDYVGTDANYTEITYNLSSFNANGSNVVLFRVNSTVNTDDFFWIDNVELIYFKNPVCYITKVNPTGANNAYTASALNQQSAVFTGLNACVKDRFLGVKANLVATDDVAYTSTNVPVIIPVLLNDVTGKPNPQTVTTVGVSNQPANGIVSVLSDGTIQYTPNPGFNGNDDFEYRVCSLDDPAVCDVALVTVQVSCIYIPNKNSVIGKIFSDNNLNGTLNTGENGMSGVILNLVRDFNGNGQVDVADQLLQSTTSNGFGDYQFIIDPPTMDQTYADAFNTNGSGSGSTGTTSWSSNTWTEINETNGLNTPSVQVTGNQLRIQGEDIYYLDAFDASTTANQSNGTVSWTGQSWVEIGETNGFATTPITITSSNGLRVSGNSSTTVIGARRSASLSGAGVAQLSFVARVSGLDDQFDYVDVEVATSSSGPWTNLTRIGGPAASATYNYDLVIPADMYSANTTIRFVSSGVGTMTSSDIVYFDDIKISYRPVSLFKGVSRTMNLANAVQATLQLNFTESGLDFDVKDYIDLEIAPTSSGPWTLLRRFTGADGNQSGLASFDISAYKAAGTTMRFATSPSVNFSTTNAVLFDNILVTYKVPSPANYIVQLAQPLPQDITLTSPTPSFTYAVAFTGAGEGSCNKSFGVARANLSVVKSASATQVNAGGTLSYTLTVTNNGPSRSTNTVVNDVLPTGFSATSNNPSQGSWASPNWTIGTLEPGQSATLVFAGNVSTSVCDQISNTANVSGSIADPVSSNNSSSVTVNVIDNIAPAITHCPSNITLDGCSTDVLTGPDFSSILTESDFDVFGNVDNAGVSSDNCGNESVWYKDSITSQCPISIHRKWFVRDIHANESQCTQIITIQDIQAPQIINAPADITLNECSLASVPPAAQNFADFENMGGEISDNCTPLENIQFTVAEVISGSCPTLVSRTYSIKDNCLNTATVVHNIYVHDTSAPEITAPDTTIQLGCNPVTLPDSALVAGIISIDEICGIDEQTITAGPVSGDCHKTQPFYLMAKDLCQNEARDTVIFTWTTDNQTPLLQGFNEVVNLGINPDTIPSQNDVLDYFSVTDACSDFTFNVTDSISVGTCQKSKLFAFEVADACGNILQDSIIFTWTDTTFIPVLSNPGNLCVGSTSTISPVTGGNWLSSNPSVASINNNGVITALSAGSVTFTYTRATDGCFNTINGNVYTKPTLTLTQPQVCLDSTLVINASPAGGNSPYSYSWTGPSGFSQTLQNVTRSPVTMNMQGLYGVTVTDAMGCSNTNQANITVNDCHGEICFIGTSNPSVHATSEYYIIYDPNPANNKVRIRTTFSKNFVDNTYGTNAIGWDGGHTFSELVGSDHLVIALFDQLNVKKMELKLDYITASASAPSGYKCLGVSGGEGSMLLGNSSDVISAVTSLDRNFNTYGYVLTSNSPQTNDDYIVNTTYPNWIYDVWYEVEIKLSAFGSAGFGSANVTGIHASPSKTGNNTEIVSSGDCCALFTPSIAGANFNCNDNLLPVELSVVDGVSFVWNTGQTTRNITVNPTVNTTYTVTITDNNGCTKVVTHAINIIDCVGNLCFTGNNDVSAESTWSIQYFPDPTQNKVRIRTTFSKNFVDNTYGTNAIGWSGGHTFSDLVGSDHLVISLFDGADIKAMELKMDYITASAAAPSGYKCLGVSGGEGSMLLGNASDVLSVTTSLDKNFNEYGYVLTSNSPSTDPNYTPNATYPNWIYEVWYEVEVKLSAFGSAGFGKVGIAGIHASPSKTGNNTESVTEGPCCEFEPYIVGNSTICQGATTTLTANVVGNGSIQLISSNDTYLDENNPTKNWGKCKEMYIGTKSGKKRRAMIKFDPSEIPTGATIISANLLLTKVGGTNTSTPIGLYSMSRDWQENAGGCAGNSLAPNWDEYQSGATWSAAGADFVATPISTTNVASNGQYSWNITTALQNWINNPSDNFGLLLKTINEGVNDEFKWSTSEEGDNTKRPVLVIFYQLPESSIIYAWSNGGTTKTVSVNPGVTTVYSVTITAPGICDGVRTSKIVTVNTLPNLSLSGPVAICQGQTATISSTAPTATAYTWSNGSSTPSIQVSPVTNTVYTLTVTDVNGCSSTQSKSLQVNNNPAAMVLDTVIQPTCLVPTGTAIFSNLPASGNWTIVRSPGNVSYPGSGSQYAISNLAPGQTYSFTLTDPNNCSSPTLSNVVVNTVPNAPVISGVTVSCQSTSTQLNPSSGGSWSSSNTAVATISNTGLVQAIAAGTTNLTYTRSSDGCAQSTTFQVNANPTIPNIGTVTQPTCNTPTGSVVLNGLPSSGTWTLTRTPGGTIYSGTGASYTVTGLTPNQTYTFTVTNSNTCVSANTNNITINPVPSNPIISGSSSVCSGATLNMTPTSGGIWSSSNINIATVTNAGVVNAIASGSVTLTFVRTSDGCSATAPLTVANNPTPPQIGTITQPTCSTASGSVVLSGLPATGNWTLTRIPGNVVYSGTGTSYTVSPLAPNQTYTFTVTRQDGCTSASSSGVLIESIPSTPTLSGPDFACVGATATMSPSTQGIWSSSNPSVASVTSAGVVTALSPGMVILTYIRNSNNCQNTKDFTVSGAPTAPVVGTITQPNCSNPKGSVTLSGLPSTGVWTLTQNPGNVSYTGSGSTYLVSNLNAGTTYTFTVKNMYNCTSSSSSNVVIQSVPNAPSVSMDYMGSVCFTQNKTLGAMVTGGTGPFTYIWSGPSGYSAATQVINISEYGNYYVTVTDANQCAGVTSGFVYESYTPFIVSLQTQVCEGQSVQLSVNSSSASGFLWSNNANSATTASVNVTPSYPSSTYTVTVTNNQGCTAAPSITISVIQKPTVSVSGPNEICVGQSSSVNPTLGGTWTSSNNAIATVTSQGIVTGVGPGLATFQFTNSTTGCASDYTLPIKVNPKPVVDVIGPGGICIGATTQLSPSEGGTWYSSNPAIATVNNQGVVTGISQGTSQFYFIDSTYSCSSDMTSSVNVDYINDADITGPDFVCESSNIVLTATVPGGSWQVNNLSLATINSSGILTGVSPGIVTVTYQYSSGSCAGLITKEIEVLSKPVTSITGSNEICAGATTTLSPTSGGIWTSANPSIATVNNAGIVTGVQEGYVTFTYQDSSTGCVSQPTAVVAIQARPAITLTGPATICIGQTTSFLPDQGGTWVSSNPAVATIANNGLVTSHAAGNVFFTFASSQSGCSSMASTMIQIGAMPSASLDFHGSPCLTDTSQISVIPQGGTPGYTYQWAGPLGFQSVLPTVSITNNGMYYATVTDSYGCKANVSGFIYQRFEPFIVNLESAICQGKSVQLSVNASSVTGYQWSQNANNATTSSVTVFPEPPSSAYFVTVTNTLGCQAVAQANITVNPKPITQINGPSPICIGQTTQMFPTSGGSWSSTQPSVATINNSGLVSGIAEGSARFIFTQQNTGCISDTSSAIQVRKNVTLQVNGPSSLCLGQTTQLTSNVSGTWSVSNANIATIDNNGLVTALSPGTVQFTFASSEGCVSNNIINISVHDKPAILLDGGNPICIGANTQFLPSAGGTWSSTNPAIASISSSGLVTGVSPGSVKFLYTSSFTGCISDSSEAVTVLSGSPITITGPNPICVGSTTTLSPTSGGMWISNNPAVASVSNGGIVTGLSQGSVTFTFINAQTGCASSPTQPITINARPTVSITGPSGICIGSTTNMNPATGGTWISNQPGIATINNAGLITGISAGMANFVFTNTATGCASLPSTNITVNSKPTASLQSNIVCVGNTTTASPASGGTWSSSNSAIATINNNGVITGISQGTATFTFTESATGCASLPTNTLTVLPRPAVSITGPTAICQGATTQVQPVSGGVWTSLNPTIATVTNTGLVTGVSNGTATFVFTSNQGCASHPTDAVTVHGKPSISVSGPASICMGSTTQLLPSTGGTWTSSRPSVATVNNSGLVTAVALGTARFVFTNSATGCKSDSSSVVTVNNGPVIAVLGSPNICIGQTGQLSPTVGGTWTSLNSSIATVNNSGLVTGIGAGQASFTFTQNSTGCSSTLNNAITVLSRPVVSVTGPSPICAGSTSQLSPTTGGSWMSQNMSVATVNNIGLVTGISQGLGTFVFTQTSTGCTSLPTSPIVVMARPSTILNGPGQICVGNTTQFLPATGGTWTSNLPAVASIDNSGLVTGLAAGTVSFTFTESATGCISSPSTPITVNPPAQLTITGPSVICLGYTTILSASTSGTWYSHNEQIAKVSVGGLVTGVAPGKVSFYFVENATGCIYELPADAITVVQCTDPDFNVTFVNTNLQGNVKTNDEVPAGTIYQNTVYLISKPDESMPTISVEEDGRYNFIADKPGLYIYHVMVCLPGTSSNCPLTELAITVVNPNTEKQNIISNLDIVYTYVNQSVTLQTMLNDTCVSETGCQLNKSLMSIIQVPSHGSSILLPNGTIVYTPASQFVGMDTIIYQVCSEEIPSHCVEATQIVTVMAGNALNSLVATDDFFALSKGGTISGGALVSNDFDPEGDSFSVIPVGTGDTPISTAFGTYYIAANGTLNFTSQSEYTGPADIIYTICDDNNFCIQATAHILIMDNLKLRIRAYLEGPLMENADARGTTHGRPLMRDNLRFNPFTGTNYLPDSDPYSYSMPMFDLSSTYAHIGEGVQTKYRNITDANTVFGVTGENAIVDWVFIELRDKNDYSEVIATRSALIQRDGDVVDLDGESAVEFAGLRVDSCYIVLRHRNHFGVMSMVVSTSDLLDFTSPATPVFDFGTSRNDGYDYTGLGLKPDVVLGYMSMWAGDFDGNGKIKFVNPDDDQNYLFFEVLSYPTNTEFMANYNFAYGYTQGDFDLNGKSKYDNPDDDKNMLFYQVLFHPLNVNFISNFNFIIEQVPPRNN